MTENPCVSNCRCDGDGVHSVSDSVPSGENGKTGPDGCCPSYVMHRRLEAGTFWTWGHLHWGTSVRIQCDKHQRQAGRQERRKDAGGSCQPSGSRAPAQQGKKETTTHATFGKVPTYLGRLVSSSTSTSTLNLNPRNFDPTSSSPSKTTMTTTRPSQNVLQSRPAARKKPNANPNANPT